MLARRWHADRRRRRPRPRGSAVQTGGNAHLNTVGASLITSRETPMSAAMRPIDPPLPDANSFLRRIDALLPTIREHAAEVEQRGKISRDVVDMLTDADVFRAMQPRQWGGLELDAATFFEGMVRIA